MLAGDPFDLTVARRFFFLQGIVVIQQVSVQLSGRVAQFFLKRVEPFEKPCPSFAGKAVLRGPAKLVDERHELDGLERKRFGLVDERKRIVFARIGKAHDADAHKNQNHNNSKDILS